ncbi:HNH endonuclease [Shewanella canadensis]|uniref:HNH endonuclease n=1 Tax=Shewanella canadensis TaxID=271096 RepID=A0A3S0K9B9_9GAMM|nr:HNH endonuclease [Shewanella canadensis]RTR38436.1 HNH endonuclease [Shewanella canadensis]
MKKLTPVIVNDLRYLDELAENDSLHKTTFPELRDQKQVLIQAYNDYVVNCGNPWSIAVPAINDKLKSGLLSHYSSPPVSIDYLDRIKDSSPDVCPMCGGFKPFTRDHILPKSDYQAWAIFSKNLVPACDCNLKRGTALKGNIATQARVLHPYFDDVLADRLLSCKITHRSNYRWFDLDIVYVNPIHPEIASIKYHTRNIVIKSGVEKWLKGQLTKLKERPSTVIQTLPKRRPLTEERVREGIEDCLDRNDELTGSKNNWLSILCHGLLNSDGMVHWLTERHNATLVQP